VRAQAYERGEPLSFPGFVRWSQHSLIGVLLMVFTWRMVPEVIQPFWAALQRGEFITGAAPNMRKVEASR
jgi:hypothetical protein